MKKIIAIFMVVFLFFSLIRTINGGDVIYPTTVKDMFVEVYTEDTFTVDIKQVFDRYEQYIIDIKNGNFLEILNGILMMLAETINLLVVYPIQVSYNFILFLYRVLGFA